LSIRLCTCRRRPSILCISLPRSTLSCHFPCRAPLRSTLRDQLRLYQCGCDALLLFLSRLFAFCTFQLILFLCSSLLIWFLWRCILRYRSPWTTASNRPQIMRCVGPGHLTSAMLFFLFFEVRVSCRCFFSVLLPVSILDFS
jgi:hypothetical protein